MRQTFPCPQVFMLVPSIGQASDARGCQVLFNQVLFGLQGSYIKGSVIGCNTFVGNGCHIEDTLLMGNDNYSNDRERERARSQGLSVLGIGILMLNFMYYRPCADMAGMLFRQH